jgi:hypothetical protein
LFELNKRAAEIFRVEEQYGLSMGPNFWFTVSKNAGASGL